MTSFSNGYALLVGVGSTQYTPWSLPVTVRDAQAIRRLLADPDRCGYMDDDRHIRLLQDALATKAGILDGLKWLKTCAEADPEATVVVYYSGHGWVQEASEAYFLIPHDINPLNQAGTALSGVEFTAVLRKIPARRLLVILDCCHAGGMATAKAVPVELPAGMAARAASKGLVEALKQGAGRAVFLSCTGSEKSWIHTDGRLSIYTDHLLEALMGAGSQAGSTEVKLSHLMTHLSKRVPETAMAVYNQSQTPYFDLATEDFPVALISGGKGLPAGGWEAVKVGAADVIRQITLQGDENILVGGDVRRSVLGHDNLQTGNIRNVSHSAIGPGARSEHTEINTGGTYIAGKVTVNGGDFVAGDQFNDYSRTTVNIDRVFQPIQQAVARLPEKDDRQEAQDALEKLKAEAQKGEEAGEEKVSRWFNFLAGMSDDIFEVVVNTFINPIAGVGTVFQKIAKKAREKKQGDKPG